MVMKCSFRVHKYTRTVCFHVLSSVSLFTVDKVTLNRQKSSDQRHTWVDVVQCSLPARRGSVNSRV